MKKLNFILFIIMLAIPALSFAGNPPQNVANAFNKMYPKANGVGWSQQGDYFVAEFIMDELEKEIWFDNQANWIMTQTDLESADLLSPAVYNSFAIGQYSTWQVENVTLVEFPQRTPVSVIEVEQDNNVAGEYQLFYSQDGVLQRTRNVTYSNDTLWPGCFSF